MNACDLPSRPRTCLIYIMSRRERVRKRDARVICWDAHPMQKKLAVNMLDGIKAEASTACSLLVPSTAVERLRRNGSTNL